jgi:hypothetical protein
MILLYSNIDYIVGVHCSIKGTVTRNVLASFFSNSASPRTLISTLQQIPLFAYFAKTSEKVGTSAVVSEKALI